MNESTKYILISVERSGSTLLASILANAGANFGLPVNKEWFRGSGDFEHQIIIDTYKHLKRSLLYGQFSDRLAKKQKDKVTENMKSLFTEVDFAKYPPLSHLLPLHIKNAGFNPSIICIIRKFNEFASSRIAKNGGELNACKEIYENLYKTTLMELSLYGGCIICYEDLIDPDNMSWADSISLVCGIAKDELIEVRNKLVKPTFSKSGILSKTIVDDECDRLYDLYRNLSYDTYSSDFTKQHRK
jgi:hypothetical protein